MICPRCEKEIPDDALLCCYCGRNIVRKPQARAHQRGNGTGTAYKNGKYWMAVATVKMYKDENGKDHQVRRKKSGFKTKGEALEYCVVLRNGTADTTKRVPTLEEYWNIYHDGEWQKLSKSKQGAYKIAWKKLHDIMYRPVSLLTVSDLRRIVAEKANTYYPARDMKVVLGHLFDLAGADGHVNRNLPDYIILPELNEKERNPFTDEEQAALWRIYDAGDRRAALPLIMIYTGMMPGEMQGLRPEMINFDTQEIVGASIKTKVRKASPIYLPDTIVPVLISEMEQSTSKTGYVWARNEEAFYRNYYAALEAAGCRRLEPYSCRHTTATALAINEGIAPQTVKKIMRWSTTKMLDRYAHPDVSDVKAAINTLSRT